MSSSIPYAAPPPAGSFPSSGTNGRTLYAAPPPPSQSYLPPPIEGQQPFRHGLPTQAVSRPTTPAQGWPAPDAPNQWNSPPQPQAPWGAQPPPPPQAPQGWRPPAPGGWQPQQQAQQPWAPQAPPPYGAPQQQQWGPPPPVQQRKIERHMGPSGKDGSWKANDLVTEPEVMLNDAQLEIWKKFDNKEIDRDGLKLNFLKRAFSGQMDWGKWWRDQRKWKNLRQWIFGLIGLGITIAFIVEQHRIVDAIRPAGDDLKRMTAGWLIPAALLFVLSFPPLIGAELIVILAALTWSIIEAWGITVLGTMMGEIVNFWLFRILTRKRQEKYESKSLYWAKLSRVSREGGFWMCLMIRYSLIPTHLSTTLFAACGVNWWVYLASTALSQPRWLFHVYTGHVYGSHESHTEKLIFTGVTIAFAVITWWAMRSIGKAEDACDSDIKQMLRQRRADELNAAGTPRPSPATSPLPQGEKAETSLSDTQGQSGVYRLEVPRAQGHRANESTSSFGSSAETVVGSNAQLNAGPKEGGKW